MSTKRALLMKSLAWNSLKVQVPLHVIRTALVVGVIAVILGYMTAYQAALKDGHQHVAESLSALTYTAAIAAFTHDQPMTQDVLKGLLQNSYICRTRIQSDDGLLQVEQGQLHPSRACQPGLVIQLYSPFENERHIGQLRADIYRPAIQQRAFATAFNETLALLLLLLASTWASWRAIHRLLTRPMLKLAAQVHAIQPGSSQRLKPLMQHQRNELNRLADDINHLLETVEGTLSEERKLRTLIEALQHQYQSIFEYARTGIAMLDKQGRCTLANPAVAKMLRWNLKVDGPFCLWGDWIKETFQDAQSFSQLVTSALDTGRVMASDLPLQSPHNQTSWLNVSVSAHLPSGGQLVECVLIDISERKQREDATRYQAEHDPLTHLHNRASGIQTLENYLSGGLSAGALLLIDVDHFKQINDTFGHAAGDAVLIHLAKRMMSAARAADVIARLGGDEFLMGLLDTGEASNLSRILDRLLSQVTRPIEILPGVWECVGISVGVALFPQASLDITSLMSHADRAMYRVKQAGRCGYCIYDGEDFSEVQMKSLPTSLLMEAGHEPSS